VRKQTIPEHLKPMRKCSESRATRHDNGSGVSVTLRPIFDIASAAITGVLGIYHSVLSYFGRIELSHPEPRLGTAHAKAKHRIAPPTHGVYQFLINVSGRAAGMNPRWRLMLAFAAFSIELVLLLVLYRPVMFGFDNYMFRDWGANLALPYFVSHGLRPDVDFGYNYGLLTVFLSDAWFRVFGATPYSCQAAMLLAAIAIAWALARAAAYLDVRYYKWAFIVVMLPFGARLAYANLAHSIDAALIANAIVEHLRGRRSSALVLSTAAVFARPAVGLVYGLILVATIVWTSRNDWPTIVRELLPAAATATFLGLFLGALYGPESLLRTILPIHGMNNYRAAHAGFFSSNGRSFYYFPDVSLGFYIGGPTGVWIACVLWLFVNAGIAANRLIKSEGGICDEVVLTCVLLHTAFVLFMFGPPITWTYCSYILVLGVIIANQTPPWLSRTVISLMIVLGLLSNKAGLIDLRRLYATTQPLPQAYGLWATRNEVVDWEHVLDLVRGHRTTLLVELGAGAVIAPELEKPTTFCMTAGHALEPELQRQIGTMRHVEFIVSPISSVEDVEGPSYGHVLEYYPELARELDRDKMIYKGEYFVVFHVDSRIALLRMLRVAR
jgi:hypothetical protein